MAHSLKAIVFLLFAVVFSPLFHTLAEPDITSGGNRKRLIIDTDLFSDVE